LPILEQVVQQLVPELEIERMPQLVGLPLVVLLVAVQLIAVQLVVLQLLGQLAVQAHSQVPLVELQQVAMQQPQNSSPVQILEPVEFHLLVNQLQMLQAL